MPDLQNQG